MRRLLAACTLAVFALALSPALFAASPEPAAKEPLGIAKAIYTLVSAGDGESGGQFIWTVPAERARLFSKRLVTRWAEADAKAKKDEDGLGAIDFDPFSASQDPSVGSFTAIVEKQGQKTATVAVTLIDPRGHREIAADETVRLDFVREGKRWAIDDLRGSVNGKPWSVREILDDYLK